MTGIEFAAPEWVHGFWAVAALVLLLLWLERRGTGAIERFVSRLMQTRLVQRPTTGRRIARVVCLGLSALALVCALMRPQWGVTFVTTPQVGAKIMVCLDVSKSMLAEDVAPNRLERAKADVQDLLPYLQGDQVGLIAFAGKATVLCPLTEDFGFFRLVLDEVNPYSVARGGTQLAEPIRKAVDGFGETSDLSRVIILITDGEDHDSFPMEAAQAAVERGIKLIAVGFGDEVHGGEIRYTDPRTGASQTIMHDGKPVISRLDGETLRQLAKMTEGVYVPAGTGVLDLKSIYDRHIAPLTRGALDGGRRAVRQEGYQYAVMAGLLFLCIAAALTGGRPRAPAAAAPLPKGASAVGRTAAALLLGVLAVGHASAQAPAGPNGADDDAVAAPAGAGSAGAGASDPASTTQPTADEVVRPDEARQVYNRALERLHGDDLDTAEKLLMAARRAAVADAELRYSASFNLGFLAAKRADRLRETEPAAALEQYRAAADWFREAVRLREDESDPRHNLEVVLRQAVALSDQLRERDPKDLAKQLDELAAAQRELASSVADLVSQVAALADPNEISALRGAFRDVERGQRVVSSDAGQVVDTTRAERDGIEATPEDQRTPEQRVRAVQLDNLLHYLHRTRERMDQGRRQFRQKQAERGYRRAAAALTELKRARDQLRDPVEVLGVVISDLSELGRYTAATVAAEGGIGDVAKPDAIPAWLTPEYLEETQIGVLERTTELRKRLEAGLASQESQEPADPAADTPATDRDTERLLAQVREAMPYVTSGEQALERARGQLEQRAPAEAVRSQLEALEALLDARERFLDVRGLIEALYTDESKIQEVLSKRLEDDAAASGFDITEYLPQLAGIQQKNLDRGDRLSIRLDEELAASQSSSDAQPADPNGQAGAEPSPQELEQQRTELAKQYLASADAAMRGAHDILVATGEGTDKNDPQLRTVDELVLRSIESIESLRRLYFSIVEHLQEAARRQSELNDETEEVATVVDPAEQPQRLGPLAPRQRDLGSLTGSIAEALTKQSQQNPSGATDPQQADAAKQQAQQLARAAELVTAAREEMTGATTGLEEVVSATTPITDEALPTVRKRQDDALRLLLEALAILQPPNQDQQDQPQQQEEQGQGEQEQEQEQEEKQQAADPGQQLQGVRDREAQRRREKEERKTRGYDAVEKDW